jgi:3,4-dihydroxy 2-butanone 4-phosphate synthase/GTP cyclohydrolase II
MGHLLDIIEPETEAGPADTPGEPSSADPIPANIPLRVDEQRS